MPRAAKKYCVIGSLDYSCTCMYMYVEKCMSTRAHGIGGLFANTIHCNSNLNLATVSVLLHLDSLHILSAAS